MLWHIGVGQCVAACSSHVSTVLNTILKQMYIFQCNQCAIRLRACINVCECCEEIVLLTGPSNLHVMFNTNFLLILSTPLYYTCCYFA
jgi:hypothetical protein